MTALNVNALMTMMSANLLQSSTAQTPQNAGETDGLFLNLLQSLKGGTGTADSAAGAASGDLLATLFSLLAPQGAPDNLLATPDPNANGEAADSEATLSLTDMMTAIQTLTGQSTGGASTLSQMMETLGDSAPDVEAMLLESLQAGKDDAKQLQDGLSLVMQELGMGGNPALMAAMLNVNAKTTAPQAATPQDNTAQTTGTAQQSQTIPATTATPAPATTTDAANMAAAVSQPATGVQTPAQSLATPGDAATVTIESAPKGTPAKGAPATTAPATPAETTSQPFEQTLTRAAQTQTTQPTQTPQVTASPQQMTAATTETAQPKKPAQEFSLPVANATQPAPATPANGITTAPTVETPAAPNLPDVPALRQIVDSISVLKRNGQTAVRLNLHPASLGQVLVQMHMNNGDVTVQVLAETSKAHALIQQHLPELKAALTAQGFGNGSFDVAMGNDASAFNAPQRQAFNWGNPTHSNGQSPAHGVDGIQTDGTPRGSPSPHLPAGRIDYQV